MVTGTDFISKTVEDYKQMGPEMGFFFGTIEFKKGKDNREGYNSNPRWTIQINDVRTLPKTKRKSVFKQISKAKVNLQLNCASDIITSTLYDS